MDDLTRPTTPSRRRGAPLAAACVVAGAAAGVAIAWAVGADATTSGTGRAPVAAAASTSAPAGTSTAAPTSGEHDGDGRHGRRRPGGPGTTGTVTAVGTDSVTIRTSADTKTYKVTSTSDIDKSGEAKLSDLKVGDAVRFDVTSGTTVIGHLHAGDEAKNRPAGHGGGPHGGPGTTGTVTAVGTDSVTIKTGAGTRTYSVTPTSDIDKSGEAKLSDLKVGDAVRFDTTGATTVIDHLHAGDEAKNRPAGR